MHFLLVVVLLWFVFLCLFFPFSVKSFLKNTIAILWGGHNRLTIRYHKGSAFCESLLQKCPILRERYTPPLWGYSGHVQTIWFGLRDSFIPAVAVKGTRHYLPVDDGSTVTYDTFEPTMKLHDEVILVIPGISNSSESDYIRLFCKHATEAGYNVAVLNHMGSLKNQKITGNRIFSYAGTGDLSLVFDDLQSKFDPDTKFIGIGFSMGALVFIRFLGEQIKRQKRFLCALSIGQGYCSDFASSLPLSRWHEMRGLYFYLMCKRFTKLIERHKDQLLTNHPVIKRKLSATTGSSSDTTTSHNNGSSSTAANGAHAHHNGIRKSVSVPCLSRERDSNGFPIDTDRISVPDERMWKARSFAELDEYYSRRVMGFDSGEEFKKWVSCNEHFYLIRDLPLLLVNAYDDPVVPIQLAELPIKYTEFNHKAMFVGPRHGGHIAFFEGGWFFPNEITWSERIIFQYIEGCRNLLTKAN